LISDAAKKPGFCNRFWLVGKDFNRNSVSQPLAKSQETGFGEIGFGWLAEILIETRFLNPQQQAKKPGF